MSAAMADTPDLPEGETRKDPSRDAALLAKRRRARSVAIAVALGVVVVLFYLVTVLKLGPGIMGRPL